MNHTRSLYTKEERFEKLYAAELRAYLLRNFPWLGTDLEIDCVDQVDILQGLYRELTEAKTGTPQKYLLWTPVVRKGRAKA